MSSDEIDSYKSCLHSEHECQDLIHYAQMGQIGRIRRRLNEREKNKIKPGSIFIYKEQESGIRRWTDKREWSPSRVQGIFLVYRDLNGDFLKKTYSIEMKDGKYHIVAYTLAEWETNGRCCQFFNKAPLGAHYYHPYSYGLDTVGGRYMMLRNGYCQAAAWWPESRAPHVEARALGDGSRHEPLLMAQGRLLSQSEAAGYLPPGKALESPDATSLFQPGGSVIDSILGPQAAPYLPSAGHPLGDGAESLPGAALRLAGGGEHAEGGQDYDGLFPQDEAGDSLYPGSPDTF